MYSTFYYQELKELDLEKLKLVLDKEGEELYGLIDSNGHIDFSAWCGHKIEAYWYPETRRLLGEVAPYVEGFAEFMYEEGYKFRIYFEKGEVFVKTAEEVDWDKIKKLTFD